MTTGAKAWNLIAGALLLCWAADATAQETQLTCNVGPIQRIYGGTPWVVYGCDDGKSLVVASGAGNPASPFYFVLAWSDAGYAVSGEGSGSRDASAAALSDLRALTRQQIEALYIEAQTSGTSSRP